LILEEPRYHGRIDHGASIPDTDPQVGGVRASLAQAGAARRRLGRGLRRGRVEGHRHRGKIRIELEIHSFGGIACLRHELTALDEKPDHQPTHHSDEEPITPGSRSRHSIARQNCCFFGRRPVSTIGGTTQESKRLGSLPDR
jgi:hypothetical protein